MIGWKDWKNACKLRWWAWVVNCYILNSYTLRSTLRSVVHTYCSAFTFLYIIRFGVCRNSCWDWDWSCKHRLKNLNERFWDLNLGLWPRGMAPVCSVYMYIVTGSKELVKFVLGHRSQELYVWRWNVKKTLLCPRRGGGIINCPRLSVCLSVRRSLSVRASNGKA